MEWTGSFIEVAKKNIYVIKIEQLINLFFTIHILFRSASLNQM